VDLAEVRKLIALVEKSEIQELELEEEGRRIRIRKGAAEKGGANPGGAAVSVPAAAAAPPAPSIPAPAEAKPEAEEAAEAEACLNIVAPMIGTFYRAPAPEAPQYVQVGDRITPDTVVCIVEAMKVMNEIKAGVSGRISDVLVENAHPVEFGQPLFRVATD